MYVLGEVLTSEALDPQGSSRLLTGVFSGVGVCSGLLGSCELRDPLAEQDLSPCHRMWT